MSLVTGRKRPNDVYCGMFNLNNLKDEIFRLLGIDTLLNSMSDYVEARVELIKFEIREEITRHLSRLMVSLILVLLLLIAFTFLSITACLILNEITGSSYLGFLMVSGMYLFIALLVYILRGAIARSVQDGMKEKLQKKS